MAKVSVVALAAAALLSACGGGGGKSASLQISAAAGVNAGPSGEGRAVLVRIVQLRSPDAFWAADYKSFLHDPTAALGDDLVGAEEILVAPDATVDLKPELDKGATHIGVVALVREPDEVEWRALAELEPRRLERIRGKKKITVRIDNRAVAIEAK